MIKCLYSVLLSFFLFGAVNAQIPTNGLVAYYPFNGNANDESGNGNHGINNGAILSSDRAGISNKAMGFDGLSSYISIPSSSSLESPQIGITISAWEKYTEYNMGNSIVCKTDQNGLGPFQYRMGINYVGPFFGYQSVPGGSIDFNASNPIPQNEWMHIVSTYDGEYVRMYVNGTLIYITSQTGLILPDSKPLEIGRDMHGGTDYFKGFIDDIRIYNRALCESEISQLYQAEAPPPLIDLNNGLVAYYPFNGNANDESGNGNNGVVSNATLTVDRFGNSAKAYGFNGVSSKIIINDAPSLNFTSSFSIDFWMKANAWANGSASGIISKKVNDIANGYVLYNDGFYPDRLNTRLQGQSYYPSASIVTINTWQHWTIIYDALGAQIKIYKDGLLDATYPGFVGDMTNSTSLFLGYAETWGQYFNGILDDIRMYNRILSDAELQTLNGGYFNYSCVNWNGLAPTLDLESAKAFDYLCSKNIIQNPQEPSAINNNIRKDEVAKILFWGLNEPAVDANTPVDDAPNPFVDLQPPASAYSKEAKALSYLEYDDGVSVFKRELTHFRPQFSILRKHVIKAMLETFNIKPYTAANAPTPTCWYNDVPTSDEMYYYILKARELGFIKQQTFFNPNNPITRKESFLILYRIMKYFETTPKPLPGYTDFFIPSNIKPDNFARSLGISDGNFNAYTKTSFAIAGLMPLTFAHSYNSAYTELPDSSYNIIEPLGKGWTHNYNCYLQRVTDDINNNLRYVISWGDGSMNSFTENMGVFTPESKGVYATLTADAGQNNFTYKTKSQVSYIFTRYVLSNRTVWVLTSVKDRNNNTLTLTWTPFPVVAVPSQIRLFKVEDGGGRYLQFTYHAAAPSKIDSVKAVTGSINRNIRFNYENNFSDLKTYVNPKGDSTRYFYEDSADATKDHLLKQIKLPKGNIVDNTYEKRKLKSTQMAGQYLTNVNTQFNYTAANNANFTESDISTTRNGITLNSDIKQDQQGNIKNAVSPTGNLSILFDDPLHSTKPTFFSNSINNLSATTNYDAMGNVTSVTKMGGGFNLKDSFTYNGFNDILTYINARNNKTEFTYNGTGNLTKIKDALGFETNMLVNSNGTVSKVTNPENIYTDFIYDAFGNTTQSSLMGAITASAIYDGASRLVTKTDPNGTVTNIEYEINDLVKRVIVDPTGLNNTVAYHYDKNDNLDTITNPKGGKTSLGYNDYDQMVEYKFGGLTKTYVYNEDGTLQNFTNQNGNSFSYGYNADGTLQTDGYANYGYDAEFNLQTLTSIANSKVISFDYDVLKRTNKITYSDFAADSVVYTYDNNSNVTSMKYPGGFKVGYEYDPLDRLIRVYNFATATNFATYTYYNDGRLKDQVNGNGTKTVYRYDSFGRLDSIGNHTSTSANIASYKFTLDNIGNHLSETNHEPALPVMAALQTEGFTYVHDSLNRMNSRGTTSFSYDNNGNNTAATGDWNSSYTFDNKDNLLTSTAPTLTCEYDALENRRRKNDTLYVLDILGGSNVLMETDVTGNPYAYYIHGLGLICRIDAAQTNPAYYHYDYRGSTTAITDSSETTTHSYRYGAFGEMLLATEAGFKNPYRYVGKYGVQYEGDSIYFMRARYYNAVKGRFLGEDPVWGINLYSYVSNNSLNYIDPSGLLGKRATDHIKDADKNLDELITKVNNTYNNNYENQPSDTEEKVKKRLDYLNKLSTFVKNAISNDVQTIDFDMDSYLNTYYQLHPNIHNMISKDGKDLTKVGLMQNDRTKGDDAIDYLKLIDIRNEKWATFGSKNGADNLRKIKFITYLISNVLNRNASDFVDDKSGFYEVFTTGNK